MNSENLTVHFKVTTHGVPATMDMRKIGCMQASPMGGLRSPDDPNDVVILQDVADVSKARTWLTSNEMKSVMEKSGVLGLPSIRFAAAA